MNRKLMVAIGASASMATSAADAQTYPEMNMRLAHFFAAAPVQSQIDQWWADEIEKRSGGKIKIKIFWSEALGKATEILDLVGGGAVEMGATAPGYFPSRLPLSGATNSLPMVFKSNRQAQIITTELAEKVPEIQQEHQKAKVWPLFYHSINNFHILCTKPVAKMEDFKGLKVRAYGEYVPMLWQKVGAVPVNALAGELYEGLQRGKLDCGYFPDELSGGLKLYEVAKYQSTADFGAIPTWPIYVNYDLWQKWPADVKKLIAAVSKEAAQRDIKQVAAAGKAALAKAIKESGVKVVKFEGEATLRKTAPDFLTVWHENMKKKGLTDGATRTVEMWRKLLKEVGE